MTRAEFTKPTRRAAYARSNGLCEAVGAVYGLAPGKRCNAPLSKGVEYDHYPLRAADGGGNGLDNCVAVCKSCHKFKTRSFDTPMAAKGKRVADAAIGVTGPKHNWPKRPMRGHASNARQLYGDLEEQS